MAPPAVSAAGKAVATLTAPDGPPPNPEMGLVERSGSPDCTAPGDL